MEFNIIHDDDISLDEILRLKNLGFSFVRSAHIGNWNKQTLILGKLGIHIIMHEYLKGNAKIYEPSYLKINGKKEKISGNDDILQLYDNSFVSNSFASLFNPSKFHFYSLRKLYENIETTSNYFSENELLIKSVLKVLVPNFSDELYKYVDENGKIYLFNKKLENGSLQYTNGSDVKIIKENDIIREIIHLFNSTNLFLESDDGINPSGIIMSSKMYLFLTCMCELYNSRNKFDSVVDLYHFSGTQMINYLVKNKAMAKDNKNFLEKAYRLVFQGSHISLPNCVNFHLVPTESFRIIGCLKSQNIIQLENVFYTYKKIQSLKQTKNKLKNEFIKNEINKLCLMSDFELKQLFNELQSFVGKRRQKKIIYMFNNINDNRKELLSELANIISDRNDSLNNLICIIDQYKQKDEDTLSDIIGKNLEMFLDEITQYDLLFNEDELYIAKQSFDMPLSDIKKMAKIISNIASKQDSIRKNDVSKTLSK